MSCVLQWNPSNVNSTEESVVVSEVHTYMYVQYMCSPV